MKISVVIPLYNKEKHIQRAINSVLNQTMPDFELIIVDDGSTDRSFEMAKAIQDPRIRIIRQENRGVSAARNRGIQEAKHDWVAFLDADDEWLPGFLEEINGLIQDYPECNVAGTGYYSVSLDKRPEVNQVGLPLKLGWRGIMDNYAAAITGGYPFNSSSYAATKYALIDVGLYPEGIKFGEDTYLNLMLALRHSMAYSYIPLSIYHSEADNRTGKNVGIRELQVTRIGKKMLEIEDVEPAFKASLYEYLVRTELIRVRSLLYHGYNKEAQDVLAFCEKSENYSTTVMKLMKWAKAPVNCYRSLTLLRNRLKKLLSYLNEAMGLLT